MFMLQRMHALAFSGAAAGFAVNAVDFDGTNDYLSRGAGLTGAADNAKGIFCCWFRRDGTGSLMALINRTSNYVEVKFSAANELVVTVWDAAGADILDFTSSSTFTDGNWHSLNVSWDTNFTAGDKLMKVYIDDAAASGSLSDGSGAFSVGYVAANWTIGARVAGGQKFNGCLAEIYFAIGQYLDFSNSTNRRKFVSALNKPVDLGVDGSLPTGSQPIVYLNNPAVSFGTNKGSGGDFSIVGSLDPASSSPSG